MKSCTDFEDRLLDYDALSAADRRAVDQHLSGCAGCREFQAALARADFELDAALSVTCAPPSVAAAVLRATRTPRPSPIPEVLDGIGWIGILTLAGSATFVMAGPAAAELIAAGGLLVAASWVTFRSYRDLRS
jgi:anti-sigma factor RsiW